jgi:hypothetical protein
MIWLLPEYGYQVCDVQPDDVCPFFACSTCTRTHRLFPLYSTALDFWKKPGPYSRKRIALRHALLRGNNAGIERYEGKQPELLDAAVAVAVQLFNAGQHMPCRWVNSGAKSTHLKQHIQACQAHSGHKCLCKYA